MPCMLTRFFFLPRFLCHSAYSSLFLRPVCSLYFLLDILMTCECNILGLLSSINNNFILVTPTIHLLVANLTIFLCYFSLMSSPWSSRDSPPSVSPLRSPFANPLVLRWYLGSLIFFTFRFHKHFVYLPYFEVQMFFCFFFIPKYYYSHLLMYAVFHQDYLQYHWWVGGIECFCLLASANRKRVVVLSSPRSSARPAHCCLSSPQSIWLLNWGHGSDW